jgi:hypothetical protein
LSALIALLAGLLKSFPKGGFGVFRANYGALEINAMKVTAEIASE